MEYFHLTTPQQNIWNLQKYYENTAIANLCGAIFYQEKRDSTLLQQAVLQFIRSQSGIRLQFCEAEEPKQYVSNEIDENIPVMTFETMEEFDRYAQKFAKEPVGLIDCPMYRFVVFQIKDKSGILVVLSHLVSDAWTFGLMAKQVEEAYYRLAEENHIVPVGGDYIDYIESEEKYLCSDRYEKDKLYWEEKYNSRPEEGLIKLCPVPSNSITAKRITRVLPFLLEQKIKAYCNKYPVTQAVLFEMALVIYLSKINSENQSVTVGVPVLNRSNAREKEIAGMFVSTMPLTVTVTDTMTVTELAKQITKGHMDTFRHQKYPYANILKALREKQNFSGNLYDVMISYQNAATDTGADTKWYSNGYSEVPFVVHIDNRDGHASHTINVDYQTAVFRDEAEIEYIIERLEYVLEQIVEENGKQVKDICVVPEQEMEKIIYEFNDTYIDYPREKCVHEMFSEQAERTPEKTALVFEDKKFTYKQLDEMSNSLAHFLREKGVKPNDVVPIIAKRSWHVIVAMLGVLKAGGAYMPVDSSYPVDRIEYMLSEVKANVILTYKFYENDLKQKIIDLSKVDYAENISKITNNNVSEDLCYVLFTSGSTGKPKAVLISHANAGNFIDNNNNNKYQCAMVNNCNCVLADTTFVFDVSIFEIYLSLLNGLSIVLTRDMANAIYLAKLIEKYEVDVTHITPTKLLMLLQSVEFQKAIAKVKMLMVGAEVFTEELYKIISQYTNAIIYNGYGPTETTIGCSFKRINEKGYKCIHELFLEQVQKTPDKVALIFENKKFTYKQLDEMSNSLAHFLREKGIKPNDVVPIIAKRSWHVIVAMLGVLKAGGAYMPIDPSYPVDRIEYMINSAKSKIILFYGYEEKLNIESINLNKFNYIHDKSIVENVNQAEDTAYIIFTSGSTGIPKGITICHRNIVNYINNNDNNVCHKIIKNQYESIVSVTNIVFDIFVTESLLPLLNGLCIYFASDIEVSSQGKLSKLFEKNKIDVLQTTPTKMKSYIMDKHNVDYLCGLNAIILGGEAFPQDLFHELKHYTNAQIYNIYGPAETTVWSTNTEVKNDDITIGKPIANTQIYILDKDNNPLPIGVAGELCIAGEGVGKGYLNRPELTAERFVPNPFATEENHHGKVMYHTGDLARWRADGEIEYLGRIDTQVKIRGLRIELGEIESVMSSYEGIGLTAVADKRDENNRQYLVGYYTSETEIEEKKLRQHLSAKLPKYMIPNYFMRLAVMPMTPSGKTDWKNLPLPDFTVKTAEYLAPTTDTEKRLAGIWQELLYMEKAGKADDFFELGGDSLLAISMLNEIETEFGVEISIKDIMEKSVLEQLAQCIEQANEVSRLTPCQEKKYILLPQQKAIYAVCSKNPDILTYNMPAKIPLPEDIDRDRLKKSIYQVLNYHKLLKSYIAAEENVIYGIYDEDAMIMFEEYKNGEEESFVRPFNLGKAPLVRIGFTGDTLLFDMHHIIADGDSLNIILRDIVTVYEGKKLRESGAEYSDYAKYFYGMDTTEHRAYFKEMLKCDFEPVVLPETKKPEKYGKSKLYQIPEEIANVARNFAKKHNLTDTMIFLGAYGILLSKYTAQKDILSSIVLQNRIHADTKNMVGMFVNTLPVCLEVKGTMTEYMQNIKSLLLNLFRYQELPFWDIANTVGMSDKAVVNTSFVYQGDGEKTFTLNGKKILPQFIDTHTAKFDLSMEVTPSESGCRIRMEYHREKYDEQLMDNLVAGYIRILSQLEKEKITDISVMSEREYHKMIEEFNDTYIEYPREKCIHELFLEQAERTPEKTALVFENKKFTYKQLDEMSNSLAHFLREKGVKPNDKVAVLLKRDEKVIITQLAVLRLGAVFIPIDSRYPKERIEYILSENDAKLIVKNKENRMIFPMACNIEDCSFEKKKELISVKIKPSDICYIIFTSGSTGRPKGCTLTSRGLVNFCRNNNILETCNELERQVCVSVNTISFDYFIAESLLPLLNGYTVVIASEEESMNQEKFARLVLNNQVNIIQTTPTRYKMYFSNEGDLSYTKQFKVIVTSGETLPLELLKSFRKNTNAAIFNPLGPSECSVWIAGGKLHLNEKDISVHDITIGKPIANTQIYILDKDNTPLPIGVAGELCIAGEGVGKGYLNRPELTAERFVPNPFATEENHHGKVMYHTGDLARWRADGEIEYLGRIDTQVKIRGLRIELGEIENVMSSFNGIGLTAVADKRDENNRQYLVGYYTSEKEIEEKKLRQHLSAKLPKYMVPNYFMHLAVMPMTPSGKIDRKNLPLPDFTVQTTEYIAPITEREKKLCHLLEELFHMEQIGTMDDFFELGGDSLTAIEYVAKAHSRGIDFALQNVFDYPTVQSLCGFLEKGDSSRVHYVASDFDKYQQLFAENVIDEAFVPKKKSLGNVLLTGATGFLGAHVLEQLLQKEAGKIYCLIRSGKKDDRRGRIHDILQYYFGDKYETEFGNRIIPVVGDIELDGLAEHMPTDVQTVIHTAATVKHYGSYEYFHRVNVEGTQHVVDYAKNIGAKLIHISTLSVSGNSMADDFTVYHSEEEKYFYETSLYMEQPLDNVYIHSKFEAEKAVYDAMLEGLEAKVIRVGNLTNRASDYKFQPNYMQNAFLTRVKAVLEFGLFPDYLMPLYAEFSPVDLTAEGIVRIAQYADKQCIFHLNSNRPIYFERFLEVVHELGISMKVVEGANFQKALQQTMKNSSTEYIFEAFQNDMDEQGRLVYDSNIHIVNDFTVWFLKKTGFEWNETDMEYIRGYIEYFREIGYLEV